MPAFAVLEPPGYSGRLGSERLGSERLGDTSVGHPERFIFLPEKFSLGAFLFGPLWMVWRWLWLELLAYLAGLAAIGSALYALDVGWPAIILIFGLIQLLLGLEATSLVRWMRVRYGWRDAGVVIADDLDLAERRFFEDRVARRAAATQAAAGSTAAGPAPIASSSLPPAPQLPGAPGRPSRPDVVGLFPQPGGGR
jgi:hypothetical protein